MISSALCGATNAIPIASKCLTLLLVFASCAALTKVAFTPSSIPFGENNPKIKQRRLQNQKYAGSEFLDLI